MITSVNVLMISPTHNLMFFAALKSIEQKKSLAERGLNIFIQ
jgi:hypothetical protein